MITKGKVIGDIHPAEVVIHLIVETFFIFADLVLWGFGCDNLDENGCFMLCVRTVKQADVPNVSIPPHPRDMPDRPTKIFPPARALATIDILFEPLTATSVRFAFQIKQKIPPFVPTWALDFVVQNGMAKIFSRMRDVAVQMAREDPACDHVAHINAPSYRPVASYLRGKVDTYLRRSR